MQESKTIEQHTDDHPENFELEVDRKALKDWELKGTIRGWVCAAPFLGAFTGLIVARARLEDIPGALGSSVLGHHVFHIFAATALWSVLATLVYWIFQRPRTVANAESLRVRVEGAFLRVTQQVSRGSQADVKTHFRSIDSYAIIEESNWWRGSSQVLHMDAMGGFEGITGIGIRGLKHCERDRDVLAAVDAAREQG